MARIGCKIVGMPDLVTRIFAQEHLVSNTYGHFRFSPLSFYTKGEGRFSDNEGDRLRGYRAVGSGLVTIPELGLYNTRLFGNGEADLLLVDRIDAPVACLSQGGHSIERSHAIMARNPDIKRASYVVYDARKLVLALTEVLARPEWFYDIGENGNSGMVGRHVTYESRMTMEVLDNLSETAFRTDDVTRAIWTKPTHFSHEEEFRLALFATSLSKDGEGQLSESIIIPTSRMISAAIVDFGNVPSP